MMEAAIVPPPFTCGQEYDMRAFCHRLLALVAAFTFVVCAATTLRADPYEDALAHFLADNFNSTIDGINGVAASGHELAEKVIGALQSGRLLFSAGEKKIFFR